MAQTSDKRKQSLYFPEEMLEEIQREAVRLDRSLSWIMQHAWKTARSQIAKMPSMEELAGSPTNGGGGAVARAPADAPPPGQPRLVR